MNTWPRGVYFPPVFSSFYMFFPCPCPLSFSLPSSCSPFLLCRPWTQQCLPHALFVTGGMGMITLSNKPCSQQSSIFLWDLDCWGRHWTLILMHVFVFPRRIPTLKNFIFISHLWDSILWVFLPYLYGMCQSLCVFVRVVQLIWVASLWKVVSVLTKKQVE